MKYTEVIEDKWVIFLKSLFLFTNKLTVMILKYCCLIDLLFNVKRTSIISSICLVRGSLRYVKHVGKIWQWNRHMNWYLDFCHPLKKRVNGEVRKMLPGHGPSTTTPKKLFLVASKEDVILLTRDTHVSVCVKLHNHLFAFYTRVLSTSNDSKKGDYLCLLT